MKKCLHLKKTKPHRKRKPPPIMTWRDKAKAEKEASRQRMLLSSAAPLAAMAGAAALALPRHWTR